MSEPVNEVVEDNSSKAPAASVWSDVSGEMQISMRKLPELFRQNFKKLDTDADGYVSPEEVASADKEDKGTKFLVDILSKCGPQLQGLSDDELFAERSGVTQADMDNILEAVDRVGTGKGTSADTWIVNRIVNSLPADAQLKIPKIFGDEMKQHFREFDTDHSNSISKAEIEAVINNKDTDSQMKNLATGMLANYDNLCKLHNGDYRGSARGLVRYEYDPQIDLSDVLRFQYFTDPDMAKELKYENGPYVRPRPMRSVFGAVGTAFAAVGTAASGVLTVFSPEPTFKTVSAGTTATLGSLTAESADYAYREMCGGKIDAEKAQAAYARIHRMIASWNCFQD